MIAILPCSNTFCSSKYDHVGINYIFYVLLYCGIDLLLYVNYVILFDIDGLLFF